MSEKQLDLRELAPADRHRTVFSTFDSLDVGSAMLLVVDHDPRPLFFQFESQRPGRFVWRYAEKGPDVWKVRIEKSGPEGAEEESEEGCCGCCGGH